MTKKITLALVSSLTLLLTSCDPDGTTSSYSSPPPSKKVVEKISPTEQRMTYDWMDENSLRSRAKTIYYLISDDGTVMEVDLSVYAKTKIGDVVSGKWKQPD